MSKQALVMPGILGCIFAVLIGSIILLFSFASFGRYEGYAPSPAAGGLLYILLGLMGIIGTALAAKSQRLASGLLLLSDLIALPSLVFFISFKEWMASALVLIIIVTAFAAIYSKGGGAALLFIAAFLGFLVGQASMTFLMCGWKTWVIQGILFILGGVFLLNLERARHLSPLLKSDYKHAWKDYAIYATLFLLSVLLIVMLIRIPDETAGAKADLAEAKAAEALGRYDVALEAYDRLIEVNRSNAAAWYAKGLALDALGKYNQSVECYDRVAELKASNVPSGKGKDALEKPFANKKPVAGEAPGQLSDCECKSDDLIKGVGRLQEQQCYSCCKDSVLKALIIYPGDVQTFPSGEKIAFVGSASCGKTPFKYVWESSIDGLIGDRASFNRSNLSIGMHNITLTIIDAASVAARDSIQIGIAEPSVCGKLNPRPKYYPVDTPCRDIWPNVSESCMEFEVCHPGLDYIVEDAVDCCDGTPIPGEACSYAKANSQDDKKRCRGLYIVKAFGTEAKYLSGYALFKACCSGYPECTKTCGFNLAGTCAFQEGFNENVKALPCKPEEWGMELWESDTDMSKNSGVLGILPTHATVNILHTGVCLDYSAAVTTLLRKAGYSKKEAFTTASTGYDLPILGNHPGHAYNIVLLSGDSKYHFVDTTGNGEGINMGHVPGHFWFTGCFAGLPVRIKVFDWWVKYCNKTGETSFNDAGYFISPSRLEMIGC